MASLPDERSGTAADAGLGLENVPLGGGLLLNSDPDDGAETAPREGRKLQGGADTGRRKQQSGNPDRTADARC